MAKDREENRKQKQWEEEQKQRRKSEDRQAQEAANWLLINTAITASII